MLADNVILQFICMAVIVNTVYRTFISICLWNL